MEKELRIAIEAAIEAGKAIMEVYENGDFLIERKSDSSPLTIADKKANEVINSILVPTAIPIISEENAQESFEERRNWKRCWIVDPLDGTKEFIKKNDEFTVNIAYVIDGKPEVGVIFAPALNVLYFAIVSKKKAFKITQFPSDLQAAIKGASEIKPCRWDDRIRVVGSRSHMNTDTLNFIEDLKNSHDKEVEMVSKGSSLKFCLVAEGEAHLYPRFAPTMEWDTAAGQAICEAVGLQCKFRETGLPVTYNRPDLLNAHFLVSHEG